ncbi:MAG: hypothetical protein ACRELF_07265, partial [Gemmataceae bacterium]
VLDQLGIELQQPFAIRSLDHLPLDAICRNIEKKLLALLTRTIRGVYLATDSDGEASDVVA